jgi:HTH-type transcriptional regulator, competence development regulator
MKMEKTFGETIKEIRQNKELTLKEVASKLKIDTSLLSKIEKNQRRPSKQFIKDFSDIFHLSERELTIAILSDSIVYSIQEEEVAQEALKVAESKIDYLKNHKNDTQCN